MGRRAGAVDQNRQIPRQRTARHTGGYDPKRVLERKGQRTLGDKGSAHHKVLRHGAALLLGEFFGEQQARQRHAQRRHHTARHNRRHHVLLPADQRQRAGDIRRLVDGSAVIGRHQPAQHAAQQQPAAAAHTVQRCVQPVVDLPQNGVDQKYHQRTDAQQAAQRHQQTGADMVQILGQFGAAGGQKPQQHTGGKTGNQRTAKAAGDPAAFAVDGGTHLCQIPAHKPRHKGGGVTDACGNKRRQHGVDHRHSRLPDGVQHNRQRGGTVQMHHQHRQRHTDAARHHKGDKPRYTVH